jgi:acyl-CoA hydrolase
MSGETISAEQAASFVESGMWLDYGATHCQPDVFDKALAARKDELEDVKIRSCLTLRPRAVIEEDPEGKHFHIFSWHFQAMIERSTMPAVATTRRSIWEKCRITTGAFSIPWTSPS